MFERFRSESVSHFVTVTVLWFFFSFESERVKVLISKVITPVGINGILDTSILQSILSEWFEDSSISIYLMILWQLKSN